MPPPMMDNDPRWGELAEASLRVPTEEEKNLACEPIK